MDTKQLIASLEEIRADVLALHARIEHKVSSMVQALQALQAELQPEKPAEISSHYSNLLETGPDVQKFLDAGFVRYHIGGGFTAWRKEVNGVEILITNEDGDSHVSENGFWIAGLYRYDSDFEIIKGLGSPDPFDETEILEWIDSALEDF